MSDRKVYVDVKVRLIIRQDDGVETSEVVNEMEYDFTDTTGNATIEDMEITDYQIVDSK
jgi:hypothetical protein